jgi:hypothetical protein
MFASSLCNEHGAAAALTAEHTVAVADTYIIGRLLS